MTDETAEHNNALTLANKISEFVGNTQYTQIEKTYALLYVSLALNCESDNSIQFLDEAFNCEVLPMARKLNKE